MTQAATQTATQVERSPVYTPATEIYEDDASVVLVAEMPGVDEKSVEVTLVEDVLTLHGKTADFAPQGFRRAYAEFERGDFKRSFVLSDRVDAAGIQASVKNGVLRVTVPKAQPAQRKIPVLGAS